MLFEAFPSHSPDQISYAVDRYNGISDSAASYLLGVAPGDPVPSFQHDFENGIDDVPTVIYDDEADDVPMVISDDEADDEEGGVSLWSRRRVHPPRRRNNRPGAYPAHSNSGDCR